MQLTMMDYATAVLTLDENEQLTESALTLALQQIAANAGVLVVRLELPKSQMDTAFSILSHAGFKIAGGPSFNKPTLSLVKNLQPVVSPLTVPSLVIPPSEREQAAIAAYRPPTDAEIAANVARLKRDGDEQNRRSEQSGVHGVENAIERERKTRELLRTTQEKLDALKESKG